MMIKLEKLKNKEIPINNEKIINHDFTPSKLELILFSGPTIEVKIEGYGMYNLKSYEPIFPKMTLLKRRNLLWFKSEVYGILPEDQKVADEQNTKILEQAKQDYEKILNKLKNGQYRIDICGSKAELSLL